MRTLPRAARERAASSGRTRRAWRRRGGSRSCAARPRGPRPPRAAAPPRYGPCPVPAPPARVFAAIHTPINSSSLSHSEHEGTNNTESLSLVYSKDVTSVSLVAVAVLSLAAAAWAVPQEGYNYPAPGDQALSSGSATGGGQGSSGSGQFSGGAGQYGSGSGQFGTGSGQFGTGSGQFGTGSGQFGTGSGQFGTGSGQFGTGSGSAQYPSVPAQYTFQWDVNDQFSGNFYGHQEQREDANTQGKYYVQLPDGRRLVVEYYADSTGYHPTITFEGEAQFPSGPNQGAGGQGYGQGGARPGQGFPQTGPGPNQGFPQGGSGPAQGFPQPGVGSGQGQSPSQSYLPPSK
ncbi:pro-resilin-like [Penaeus vannamei]|uniref:pro-resilin-like n=1 Tax=Penaeus vannamei TaxID=6689 RepID=UPI00387F6728